MRGSPGQDAARTDFFLFTGCIALALLALALPRSWSFSIAAALRQTVLRPVVAIQARANQDRTSRFSLHSVERSRDSLAVLVQQQDALRRENDNLRGLVGVRARLTTASVSAEVLHRPTVTDARMLLLDAGSASGVRNFDPVVTAEGLIGYIVSTGPHSSSALTWANPDFAASAMTADGRVSGFIHPAPGLNASGPTLELTGVALRDSLPRGTSVLTAGAGGTFPRGIPVGRIVSMAPEVNGYGGIYRVIPFASPGAASHVIILISPRDSVFPAPSRLPLPPPAPALPAATPAAGVVH